MIYLDNAATTFPKPLEVYDAVDCCQRNYAVNVGRGAYPLATNAAKMVDETRSLLAVLVHADDPSMIVFTPSATIAANEIVMGLKWDDYKNVYVSPFEHNAIARPLQRICAMNNIRIRLLPFNSNTQQWDEEETARMFSMYPPDYVFVNHVSNVTGLILPIEQIATVAKRCGASAVIADASQSLGVVDINMRESEIDYIIFAGHKNLYASFGIGGFISKNIGLMPVISGGTGSDSLNLSMSNSFPVGFEAGSPNIIAISSLNASLKWLNRIGEQELFKRKNHLMGLLIQGLESNNKISLYLPKDRGAHTSVLSLNVDGYLPYEVGTILGEDFDIAARAGFHCAPFVHKLLGTEDTMGTVRLSPGYFNTEADIETAVRAIGEISEE